MATQPDQNNRKHKSGRLSVFARSRSDGLPPENGSSQEHEAPRAHSENPAVAAPPASQPLTREEIARSARVAVPRAARSPSLPQSPRKTVDQPPRKITPTNQDGHARDPSPESVAALSEADDETRRTLFEGSQLGESFMNSGLTTPQNEMEDVYIERVAQKGQKAPEPTRREDVSKDTGYARPNRGFGSKSGFHFQVTENGKFAVEPGPSRRSPSNMRDGFQKDIVREPGDAPLEEYTRPSSPAKVTRNMPIREVKIRGSGRQNGQQRAVKVSPKKTAQAHNNQRWPITYKEVPQETSMVINLDEDDTNQIEEDQTHETPKANRSGDGPRKSLLESSMPPMMSLVPSERNTHSRKRSRASADYDDQALSSMSHTALQNEPFDWDPAQAARQGHAGDAASLTDKLQQFSQQPERDQRIFFASMSMQDWEESGDWFVDRFSDLMKKLKDARRHKRHTMQQFENEAFEREEAVRVRAEAIDRKLNKMRQDGQRVVGDRCF